MTIDRLSAAVREAWLRASLGGVRAVRRRVPVVGPPVRGGGVASGHNPRHTLLLAKIGPLRQAGFHEAFLQCAQECAPSDRQD